MFVKYLIKSGVWWGVLYSLACFAFAEQNKQWWHGMSSITNGTIPHQKTQPPMGGFGRANIRII